LPVKKRGGFEVRRNAPLFIASPFMGRLRILKTNQK